MITCKFHGQLGNNMFQLAEILSVKEKTGHELKLLPVVNRDTLFNYDIKDESHPRTLEFKDTFDYDYDYLTNEDLAGKEFKLYSAPDLKGQFRFTDPPLGDNAFHHGYFQSEKYFKDIEDKIKNIYFKPRTEIYDFIDNKYKDKSFLDSSLSIHYRMGGDRHYGDMQEYHTDVSANFYERAIIHVLGLKKIKNLVVFSDRIEWCKENLHSSISGNYDVHYIEDNPNYVDLFLMAQCENNIIGNSTFSWWSAWLNENKEKIVVAPETEWFGPKLKHIDLTDLFPKSWVRL